MKTTNVWENQEQISDDVLRGISEEIVEEEGISMYDAAFLETYD